MKFDLGPMTQEFVLLAGTISPATSWELVRQSTEPWVVIEQPVSRESHRALEEWESYARNAYHVIDKVEFLGILDKHKDASGIMLESAMNLDDLHSNDIVLKDGLTLHPRQGRGRHDLGRFTSLAVVVAGGAPLALLNWKRDKNKPGRTAEGNHLGAAADHRRPRRAGHLRGAAEGVGGVYEIPPSGRGRLRW